MKSLFKGSAASLTAWDLKVSKLESLEKEELKLPRGTTSFSILGVLEKRRIDPVAPEDDVT
jgi:hypothetical protein